MHISLIFVLIIVDLTNAANNDTSEPSQDNNNPKIINGSAVSIEEIPYQVSLRRQCWEKTMKGLGHFCGGSLISRRVVVSAAHCFFRRGPDNLDLKLLKSSILVVMGNTYLDKNSSTERSYRVADVKIHNNYVDVNIGNDIALILIDGVVKLSSAVQLIELNKFSIKTGTMCQVSGWGWTKPGHASSELLKLNVPIHDAKICFKSENYENQPQICAGNMNSSNGACYGDSGGPLVCNGVLVGIVSFGAECGQVDIPDVYTNVAYFYDWIIEQNKTFNKKHRAKSMADSLVSFDRCCFTFALLTALLHEGVY